MSNLLPVSISIAALSVIWILVFKVRHGFITESFRLRIFSLRDDMFLYCAENELPHDTPAYVRLRTTLNGMIYLADKIPPLMLLPFLARERVVDHAESAINELSEPHRGKFIRYKAELEFEIFRYLIERSVILSLCLHLWFKWRSWGATTDPCDVPPRARPSVTELEAAAYRAGDDRRAVSFGPRRAEAPV